MSETFTADDIKTIDDAITEKEKTKIIQAFSNASWRLDWPVSSTPFARPCWHFFIAGSKRSTLESCEDELTNNETWGFLIHIWRRIRSTHLQNSTLLGVYANGQTFGQDSPIHRDNLAHESGNTIVLFCNDFWATSWGGELTFCNNSKDDLIAAVLPKPGRITIFKGQIPHRARCPSVDCDRLRITIAFKTINKEPSK
ncbi:2OG-Fe(II) oxygenase [Pseudomonas sp. Teo4]|uniref:2OG-Fe(II) oxygenase n=1 Tax=Pseudomonas sp. Teo4 TaxID=3064528 RepID=UPI002ACB1668|nr:2OG-Fe(II) oxygenase [Pseudomonas sp. Teo4]